MTINNEFVEELYALCRKYKVNMRTEVETDESGYENYSVEVTGAWDISKSENAVEVWKKRSDEFVSGIKGEV